MIGTDEAVQVIEREAVELLREQARDDARRDLEDLIARGLSPVQALDYYFVVDGEYTRVEWSRIRGTSHQAIAQNVRRARSQLDED